jgi:hypothetical protein
LPTASATGRLTHGLPRAAGSVATAAYVGTNPKLGFIRRRRFTTTSCSAFETFSKPPPETVHHQGRTPESRIERTVGHEHANPVITLAELSRTLQRILLQKQADAECLET